MSILNCYVLNTRTIFSIPLKDKISIKKNEYSTIDILKKYIWECEKVNFKFTDNASNLKLWHVNVEDVVGIFNEVDIKQKLKGNKMNPNFLFNKYFIDKPSEGNIHIIIQLTSTLIFYFLKKIILLFYFFYNILITFISTYALYRSMAY